MKCTVNDLNFVFGFVSRVFTCCRSQVDDTSSYKLIPNFLFLCNVQEYRLMAVAAEVSFLSSRLNDGSYVDYVLADSLLSVNGTEGVSALFCGYRCKLLGDMVQSTIQQL